MSAQPRTKPSPPAHASPDKHQATPRRGTSLHMSRVGGFSSAAEPLDRKGKSSSASKTYGRRRLSVEGLASGAALESPPQKPQRRGSLGKMYAEEKMEVGMRRTTGRERLTRTGGKERRKSEGAGPKTKAKRKGTFVSRMIDGLEQEHRPHTPGRGLRLPAMTLTNMQQAMTDASMLDHISDGMVEVTGGKLETLDAPRSPRRMATGRAFPLPRGGCVVETKAGPVQFGMPPETIKDHMNLGRTVPTTYVVPFQRFHRTMAINVAEFEFPAYFNFFVLRKKIRLVCTASGEAQIRSVFQETLLGPKFEHLMRSAKDDYSDSVPHGDRADLVKEMKAFAKNPFDMTQELTVDLLIEFVRFEDDEEWKVTLEEGVTVSMLVAEDSTDGRVTYVVREGNEEIARVPDEVSLPTLAGTEPSKQDPTTRRSLLELPAFGVTFLGTSHGFDPKGSTTGFVLWIHGRGILVDPPPNAGTILNMMGVPPRIVDTVLLTHCHADHDAGTFQKLLHEEQVTLITTQTILRSFMRKYSALAGIEESILRRLFIYKRCRIGEPLQIWGAQLECFYALHTIPCMGFKATFHGKSIVYSADTLRDAARIEQMHEDGVLSAGRKKALIDFPWDSDLILHEAGVPPIHTPVSFLADLPDAVKQRMYLVHTSEKDVPRGKGLRVAREGSENTLVVDVDLDSDHRAISLLDAVSNVGQLASLRLPRAQELLRVAQYHSIKKGEKLKEHVTNSFLIVLSGCVRCVVDEMAALRDASEASSRGGSSSFIGRSSSQGGSTNGDDDGSFISQTGSFAEKASSDETSRAEREEQTRRSSDGSDREPPSPFLRPDSTESRRSSGSEAQHGTVGIDGALILNRWEFFPPPNFWRGHSRVSIQRCPVSEVEGIADNTEVALVSLRDLNTLLKNSIDTEQDFRVQMDHHDDNHLIAQSVLQNSSALPQLSAAQRSDFAQMMNAVSYKPGQFVWKLGDNAFFSFLVATGQVHVQGPRFKHGVKQASATMTVGEEAKGDETKGTDTDTATKRDSDGSIKEQGELLIDESYWLGTTRFSCSLQAKTAVTGYVITVSDIRRFAVRFPKFLLLIREQRENEKALTNERYELNTAIRSQQSRSFLRVTGKGSLTAKDPMNDTSPEPGSRSLGSRMRRAASEGQDSGFTLAVDTSKGVNTADSVVSRLLTQLNVDGPDTPLLEGESSLE